MELSIQTLLFFVTVKSYNQGMLQFSYNTDLAAAYWRFLLPLALL